MELIKPVTVDASVLTSSNAVEETAWNSGTTYAEEAITRVGASLYMSVQAGNTNHDPATDDGTWWNRIGAANRWKMFDQAVGSQTENANSIAVVLDPLGIVDSFTLLNLSAATAHIVFEADGDTVYDETFQLVDNSGVIDWPTYFFSEIKRQTDLAVTGVSLYANPTITVTLTETGETVKCGALIVGMAKAIGITALGPRLGIDDFSRKETDDFGQTTLVRRSFRRRGDYSVLIDNGTLDGIYTLLSDLRATPLVWIPSDSFGATFLYGWYREFQVEIAYSDNSLVSLSLEGLS